MSKLKATLNQLVDAVYKIDQKLADLNFKTNALKVERDTALEELMRAFTAEQIESAKGRHATAYISRTRVANVKDWNALEAYVLRHKALDLFQRRIHNKAYLDRLDNGKVVPGVEVFERVAINLKKRTD